MFGEVVLSSSLAGSLGAYWQTRRHTNRAIRRLSQDDYSPPLPPGMRERCREYSRAAFGTEKHWRWLMVYATYRGEFLEGWIPEGYFGFVMNRTNRRQPRAVRRSTMREVLQTDAAPDIAYWLDGRWTDRDYQPLAEEDVARTIFADGDVAVLKLERSNRGFGIYMLERETFSPNDVPRENFVVQSFIRQHDWFEPYSPGSTATLRLTSVRDLRTSDPPRVVAGFLRCTMGEDRFLIHGRNLATAVDIGAGRILDHACRPGWIRVRTHPDTGARFDGQEIPGFAAAKELCETLHARIPQYTVVGWDLGINARCEPELMELNTSHPGIKFNEAATGPHFRDLDFERFAREPA